MILIEIVGRIVSLFSSCFIAQPPPISRETSERDYTQIYEENPENEEAYDGLVHREYEPQVPTELPYYDDNPLSAGHEGQTGRSFVASFLRSFRANIGLIAASVFILGLFIVGMVNVDLKTRNFCRRLSNNFNVPYGIADIIRILPLHTWFPMSIGMLWGFKELKKNYLYCLLFSQLLPLFVSIAFYVWLNGRPVARKIQSGLVRGNIH